MVWIYIHTYVPQHREVEAHERRRPLVLGAPRCHAPAHARGRFWPRTRALGQRQRWRSRQRPRQHKPLRRPEPWPSLYSGHLQRLRTARLRPAGRGGSKILVGRHMRVAAAGRLGLSGSDVGQGTEMAIVTMLEKVSHAK
jgi:hypothetical protein